MAVKEGLPYPRGATWDGNRRSLCGTARLRLLPAVRAARPRSVPALPRAARLLLRGDGGVAPRRAARPGAPRHRALVDPAIPLLSRRRRDRGAPGVAAAPAARQGAGVRAGPLLHARELPADADGAEALPGHRRVRRGGLDLPRPVDRRVVARLVRALLLLRPLARDARQVLGACGRPHLPRGRRQVPLSELAQDLADQQQRRA